MNSFIAIGAIVAAVVIVVIVRAFRPGYRGAIGFKNRHTSEIIGMTLAGFSKPVTCGTLKRTEHSFNFMGRQKIPDTVTITWRFVTETSDRTSVVPLTGVPKDAKDGELFFVLADNGAWAVEFAPELQLDRLQQGR